MVQARSASQSGEPLRRQRFRVRRGVLVALLAAGTATLVGCASIPVDHAWQPPQWQNRATGAVTVESTAATAASSDTAPVATEGALSLHDTVGPGAISGRIRNDGIHLQARYIEIAGAAAFNARVRGLLTEAVSGTEATYVPEVFPATAGLGDRGCIAGALTWPAAQVLSDERTGPAGGTGTAVVCEITSAFDSVVGVSFRTVAGTPTGVTADRTRTFFIDVATDTLTESAAMWEPAAAADLWTRVAESVRRDAGALSAAPLAEPDAAQLELAQRALETAGHTPEGGATFVVPAGLTSPELEQLGVEPTTDPIPVTVDAEVLDAWDSDTAESLFAKRGTPFSGLPEWRADLPVDCALVACVAVTYDDGPSSHTQQLLDSLRAERAPATFYMLGPAAQQQPALVRAAAATGFEIGSHTMTHTDLTTLKPRAARAEVRDAERILSDLVGAPVRTYRPPYGAVNDAVLRAVNQPAILWTIDTLDWKDPGVDELVARSVDVAKPGDIILFHDTHGDSVEAVGPVMRGLRDRGLTPVTVSTMFGGSPPYGKVFGR